MGYARHRPYHRDWARRLSGGRREVLRNTYLSKGRATAWPGTGMPATRAGAGRVAGAPALASETSRMGR